MIIVTGGAGFIGSNLIRKLNEESIDEILIVDSLGKSDKWKNLVGKNFHDIVNKRDFFDILEKMNPTDIKAIVHLGACSSTTEKDADYLLQNNFHYTQKLIRYALKHQKRIIYASSAATYGSGEFGYSDYDENTVRLRPLNMYGYSKQLVDEFVIKNKLQKMVVGLKFFNVFGPNEYHKGSMRSMVHKAYQQIIDTGKVQLFKSDNNQFPDGGQMRDFIYVKDCSDTIWWLIMHPEVNGIYNLGTGTARSWKDLANAVFSALNLPPNIEYIDMPQNLIGKYQNYTQAEMVKFIAKGLQHNFYTLEDAIEEYIKFYLSQNNQYN